MAGRVMERFPSPPTASRGTVFFPVRFRTHGVCLPLDLCSGHQTLAKAVAMHEAPNSILQMNPNLRPTSPRAASEHSTGSVVPGSGEEIEQAVSELAQPAMLESHPAAGRAFASPAGPVGITGRLSSDADISDKQPCRRSSGKCGGVCSGGSSDRAGRPPSPRKRRRPPTKFLLLWLAVTVMACTRILWAGQVGSGPRPLAASPAQPPSPAPPAHRPRKRIVWPVWEPARRANLRPFAVMNESSDACVQLLGLPKVALLFMTMGALPQEPMWREWFRAAEGLLPAAAVGRSGACETSGRGDVDMQVLQAACRPIRAREGSASAASTLSHQHLFSVYVHTPPDFPGFPPFSLFGGEGTLIAERVPTNWGSHSLVEAARALLWAAVTDPANHRFMLLSESDIPLYDPLTTYQQLLSESRSRVNACPSPTDVQGWWRRSSLWRWTPAMQFNYTYWRKSSQWFTLTRPHAEAVLADIEVFRAFESHCWSGWVPEVRRYRDCYADEHYLPTLLAMLGLEDECACEAWRGAAYVEWNWGPHPRIFEARDVSAALIKAARGQDNTQACPAVAAQEDAARLFVHHADLLSEQSRAQVCSRLRSEPPNYAHPLDPTCALTARKFAASTSTAVLSLYTGCEGARVGLLGPQHAQRVLRHCRPNVKFA